MPYPLIIKDDFFSDPDSISSCMDDSAELIWFASSCGMMPWRDNIATWAIDPAMSYLYSRWSYPIEAE